jgi:hypothetical protein
MKHYRIKQTAETYLNGNISDAKKTVKRMNKADFLELIAILSDYYYGDGDYRRAITDAEILVK